MHQPILFHYLFWCFYPYQIYISNSNDPKPKGNCYLAKVIFSTGLVDAPLFIDTDACPGKDLHFVHIHELLYEMFGLF